MQSSYVLKSINGGTKSPYRTLKYLEKCVLLVDCLLRLKCYIYTGFKSLIPWAKYFEWQIVNVDIISVDFKTEKKKSKSTSCLISTHSSSTQRF